ncbi:MAG: DNA-directed RNA polymerase specialized sigma24 family protein [Myxococcota bacterium]|jgi:DNA-directed RNA polymerase specialized sigma24 family protein
MARVTKREVLPPGELQRRLRLLLADRRSAEAAALFQTLMRFSHRRVLQVSRRCGGQLTRSEREELVSEVVLQLVRGGLARFRGESMPELYGFVRTIADRCTWKAIRGRERELKLVAGMRDGDIESWGSIPPKPDQHLELIPDSPLDQKDQDYLCQLLTAGTKAELARRAGVSRAAVTQRVQRIRKRIDELAAMERMAHDVWMRHTARHVLEAEETYL